MYMALRLRGIFGVFLPLFSSVDFVSKQDKNDTMPQRAERVDYWHGTTPIAH